MPRIYPIIQKGGDAPPPAGDRDATFLDSADASDNPRILLRRDDSLDATDGLRAVTSRVGDTVDAADAARAEIFNARQPDSVRTFDFGDIDRLVMRPTQRWDVDAANPNTTFSGNGSIFPNTNLTGGSNERHAYVQWDLHLTGRLEYGGFLAAPFISGGSITFNLTNNGLVAQNVECRFLAANSSSPYVAAPSWNQMGEPDTTPGPFSQATGTGPTTINVPAGGIQTLAYTFGAGNPQTDIGNNGAVFLARFVHLGGILGTEVLVSGSVQPLTINYG